MNMRDQKIIKEQIIKEQVSVAERISLGETVLMSGSLGLAWWACLPKVKKEPNSTGTPEEQGASVALLSTNVTLIM